MPKRMLTTADTRLAVAELDEALTAAETLDSPVQRSRVPTELLGKPSVSGLTVLALQDWALIVGCWCAMLVGPWQLYPLWALLVAGRIHSLGVILHDATHMPLHGKPLSVRFMELLAGYPLATTLNAMRYHHLRHHRDTNMPTDPYFKKTVRGRPLIFGLIWLRHLILIPLWTLRGPFGLLALAFPKLRNAYAKGFLQDRSGKDLTHHPEVIACAKEELGQVIVHVFLYTALFIWPEVIFYGYLLPAAIAGLLAGYRVLREHDYLPVTTRKPQTIMLVTNDHNLGPFGQILLAPRNIGCHIVHHLHPQVALQNLPRLRQWYIAEYPQTYPKPARPLGWMRSEGASAIKEAAV